MHYLLRRLAVFPLVLLGVSLLVFASIRLIPGDAITAMLGTEAGLLTEEQRASLEAYFGIDQSWPVQYGRWLSGAVRGDWGVSVTFGEPVLRVIMQRFPLSLELAVLALLVALALGLPAGIFAATRNGRASDLGVRLLALVGQSSPNFVVGLLLIYLLSVGFGVLPPMGEFISPRQSLLGNLGQMLAPALTLGFAFAASVTRVSRSAMLDVLSDDFVRTARSRGAAPKRVIWRHALPNALVPVLTLTGIEFGYLLGGTVIAEQIFALPGMGRMMLDAIQQRDYPLVQGGVLFAAAGFMLVNLLVDLAYALLDPRIRLGESQ